MTTDLRTRILDTLTGYEAAITPEGAFLVSWPGGFNVSSTPFELSTTSAVVAPSAGYRTLIYSIKAIANISGGWHQWAASAAGTSALDGYVPLDTFGGYIDRGMPLYVLSAGVAFAFQASALVSAVAGAIRYGRLV